MSRTVVVCLFLAKILNLVFAKVSEKEYASMPDIFQLDNWDRCAIHGEHFLYCMIRFQLFPLDSENVSNVWRSIEEYIQTRESKIQEVNSYRNNYRHDILQHGICIPELLSNASRNMYEDRKKLQQNIENIYNHKYKASGLRGNVIKIGCENVKSPFESDVYDSIFEIFLFAYCMILIGATLYEIFFAGQFEDFFFEKIASALSVRKNWQRLTTVSLSTQDMKDLSCLQGFRFYDTTCIIFYHTILMNAVIPSINPRFFETITKEPKSFELDPSYLMQVFFMISNLLLCYQFFLAQENGEKISPKYFFNLLLKRYIRLTPTLAITIAFVSTWMIHISRGPMWAILVGSEYRKCRKNWWTNLLYINNFVDSKNMCFQHSWYLAVNMQFYVLSFPLLYLMYKYPKKVLHLWSALIFLHLFVVFSLLYKNNLPFVVRITPREITQGFIESTMEQYLQTHCSLYVNSAGAICGLIFGYIFYKIRNKRFKIKKIHVAIWWAVIFLTTVVSIMDACLNTQDRFYNAFYGSLRRIIFTLATGVLFLGMVQGQGWILKWMCETSPVYVLGRLTYGAYIIHPVIQLIKAGSQKNLFFFTPSTTVFSETIFSEAICDVTISFLGAFVMALLVEIPMIELQKMYAVKSKYKKKI